MLRSAAACLLFVMTAPAQTQTAQEELVETTRSWLKLSHEGDRAGLNAIMDARCLLTTPAGDVLSKEQLVPDDPERAVHRLDSMELVSPMVRIYGDTAVLMSSLKLAGPDSAMNGTFVYVNRENRWKLVGLQLSRQK